MQSLSEQLYCQDKMSCMFYSILSPFEIESHALSCIPLDGYWHRCSRYICHLIICIGLARLLLCDDHEYLFSFILTLHLPSSLFSVFLLCPCRMFFFFFLGGSLLS